MVLLQADTAVTASFGSLFASTSELTLPTDPNWSAAWNGTELTLTPKTDVTVAAGKPVEVPLGSFTPDATMRSQTVWLECDYSTAVQGGVSVSGSSALLVQAKPAAGSSKNLDLRSALVPGLDVVYRTPDDLVDSELPNILQFSITNPNAGTPLVADGTSSPGPAPELQLWFAYAPDEKQPHVGALTTLEHANDFNVSVVQGNWNVDDGNAAAGYWLLTPGDSEILGSGLARPDGTELPAAAVFSVGNVVTHLAAGTTVMYLQWRNIPGYADGLATLPLVKREPVPGILGFVADPLYVNAGSPVTLTWTSYAVESVQLEYPDPDPTKAAIEQNFPANITTFTFTPTASMTFTVEGFAGGSPKGDDKQQTVTLVKLPAVSTFTFRSEGDLGSTDNVVEGELVMLSWTTVNADAVLITVGDSAGNESAPIYVQDNYIHVTNALAPNDQAPVRVTRATSFFRIVPSNGGVAGPPSELAVDVTPTITFSVWPPEVPDDGAGHDVTLSWTVDDADAELVITPQVGDVKGLTEKAVQAKAGDTLTLTASRKKAIGDGSVQAVATVVIGASIVVPRPLNR
jgi:hypothetical protein